MRYFEQGKDTFSILLLFIYLNIFIPLDHEHHQYPTERWWQVLLVPPKRTPTPAAKQSQPSQLLPISGKVSAVLDVALPPGLGVEDMASPLCDVGRSVQMKGYSEVAALIPDPMYP